MVTMGFGGWGWDICDEGWVGLLVGFGVAILIHAERCDKQDFNLHNRAGMLPKEGDYPGAHMLKIVETFPFKKVTLHYLCKYCRYILYFLIVLALYYVSLLYVSGWKFYRGNEEVFNFLTGFFVSVFVMSLGKNDIFKQLSGLVSLVKGENKNEPS